MIYYEHPTQVMFYREDIDSYSYGIAFESIIIDGSNGDVYKIRKIKKPIYEYSYWVDLTEQIHDGE